MLGNLEAAGAVAGWPDLRPARRHRRPRRLRLRPTPWSRPSAGARRRRARARRAGAARRRPASWSPTKTGLHDPGQHRRGDGPVPRRPARGDQPGHRRRVRRPAGPRREWPLGPGPARASARSTAQVPLPPALGGGHERLVAADGASVRQAINDGAQGSTTSSSSVRPRNRSPSWSTWRCTTRRDRAGPRRRRSIDTAVADRLHAAGLRRPRSRRTTASAAHRRKAPLLVRLLRRGRVRGRPGSR